MFLFGFHACIRALENPHRVIERVLVTGKEALNRLPSTGKIKVEIIDKSALERLLPAQSVHQGVALKVQPLKTEDLSFLDEFDAPNQCVLVLDQVTDPHNIGAILRSAAAFGAKAVVLTARNAPQETAVMAKTASGAMDVITRCTVSNLSQALERLKKMGFWTVGFSEHAKQSISSIDLRGKIALVMGSEGDGLRPLTQKNCDFLVALPTSPNFPTLNVSNAAAVALYEMARQTS